LTLADVQQVYVITTRQAAQRLQAIVDDAARQEQEVQQNPLLLVQCQMCSFS